MSKPRVRKVQAPKISRALLAFLRDERPDPNGDPNPVMTASRLGELRRDDNLARKVVVKHGPAALADFIAAKPGNRPAWWWRQLTGDPALDAPEPMRERVGGVGMAWHSHETGGKPYPCQQDAYGVPLVWPSPWVMAWKGTGWWTDRPGPAIAPEDPPLYESSAAYLNRHGLLTGAERAALTDEDFAPEIVGLDYGEPIEP